MNKYINLIVKLAKKAYKNNDVPVGAIIVENNKIISKSYNKKEKNNDPTAHAEILAIRKACKHKKDNYLNNCTLYVTLEPCMMCLSAIEQSHIKEIVYILDSPKYGYLFKKNTKIKITKVEDEYEYSVLLKKFFKSKR